MYATLSHDLNVSGLIQWELFNHHLRYQLFIF